VFDARPKLPASYAARVNAVMSDAAASDDSDRRNIVHAGTTLVATALAVPKRTGARARKCDGYRPRYEAAGRMATITPAPRPRLHGCLVAIFGGRSPRAAVHSTRAYGAGHRPLGDLDRRAAAGGEHERRPRVSRGSGGDARRPGSTAARNAVQSRRKHPRSTSGFSRSMARGRRSGRRCERDPGQTWTFITDMASSSCRRSPYHALAEAAANARQKGISQRRTSRASPCRSSFTTLTGPLHPTDLLAWRTAQPTSSPPARRSQLFLGARAAAKIADPPSTN